MWERVEKRFSPQAAGGPEVAEKKLDGMVTAAKNFIWAATIWRPRTTQAALWRHRDRTGNSRRRTWAMLDKFGVQVSNRSASNASPFPKRMCPPCWLTCAERKAEADRLRAEGDKERRPSATTPWSRARSARRPGESRRCAAGGKGSSRDLWRVTADPDFYAFWRSLEACSRKCSAEKRRSSCGPTRFLRRPHGTGTPGQGPFETKKDGPSGAMRSGSQP